MVSVAQQIDKVHHSRAKIGRLAASCAILVDARLVVRYNIWLIEPASLGNAHVTQEACPLLDA
jgi:hypothetical protein